MSGTPGKGTKGEPPWRGGADTMGSTYHSIQYHITFSTRDRRRWITPEVQEKLQRYLGGIIKGEGGVLREIGGIEDHVHLLIRWRTDAKLSDLMMRLKSKSSKWIHETFPDLRDFRWQEGYAAFSVSQSQVARVKMYIARQREHHQRQDFQCELRGLLTAHGVEYDRRYL